MAYIISDAFRFLKNRSTFTFTACTNDLVKRELCMYIEVSGKKAAIPLPKNPSKIWT